MFTILTIRNAFSDYFSDSYESTCTDYLDFDKNYFFEFCSFGPSDNPGILIIATNVKVVVESCYFHEFSQGAILFEYAGEFVQRHVCSFKSSNDGDGQHSFVYHSSGEYKNYAIESSISSCGNLGHGNSPFFYSGGIMINIYNNISSCKTKYKCGFYMQNSFNRTTTKFCSFYANTASTYGCANPYESEFLISNTNIINNSVSDQLIGSNSDGIIDSCVILNNIGKNIFYCYGSNSITVIHCFCNQTERFGKVNISLIDTEPFINNVKYFSSYLCQTTKLNFFLNDEIESNFINNFLNFFLTNTMICCTMSHMEIFMA